MKCLRALGCKPKILFLVKDLTRKPQQGHLINFSSYLEQHMEVTLRVSRINWIQIRMSCHTAPSELQPPTIISWPERRSFSFQANKSWHLMGFRNPKF